MDFGTEEDEQLDRPATGTPVEDELFQSDDEEGGGEEFQNEEGFASDDEEFQDSGEGNSQSIEPNKSKYFWTLKEDQSYFLNQWKIPFGLYKVSVCHW